MSFEYMFSADIFVEDMHRQVETLVARFGIHPPGPRSIVTGASDAHAIICRLDRDLSRAPTRLEVIQGTGSLEHWNGHHITQAWRDQVARPTRFHNTVAIARDVGALREELAARGVPTMFDDTLEFDRLWVGISPREPTRYEPRYDAGLRIEVLPFASFPVDAEPVHRNESPSPGRLVRVVNRSFVVDDLDETLRTLEANLAWAPEGPVRVAGEGYREAVLAFRLPRSAKISLRQPVDAASPLAAFAARWGEGPYAIGVAVAGIDAAAEQLRANGVAFTETDAGDGRRHLRIGADVVGGTVFELLEADDALDGPSNGRTAER